MNIWFTKDLGDAMLASEQLAYIEEQFLLVYGATNRAKEVAVFIRHESEGRLHCEIKAYFSPATVAVARAVSAAPCERPSRTGLSLLVGFEESLLALFPEYIGQ